MRGQLVAVLLIVIAAFACAFNVARPSNSGVALKMALKDYKEELAKTAAAIAAPGKVLSHALSCDDSTDHVES